MKYLKIGIHELIALALLTLALLLRLFLASQNWPFLDSDEGTFGLMARHIAYRGEFPTFLDGYHYMGALQSYIGAMLFHLFGPTLFALRFGIILLIILFLISIYLLTRALYTKNLALVVLILLCGGSHYVLEYQIHAYGGYPETLLYGTLLFLFAFWLASTSFERRPRGMGRSIIYIGWGGAAGLGLWSDMLIAPFILTSGLLLLLFCWRELLRIIPVICIIIGLCIGGAPVINYNLHAAPGDDSLSVLKNLHQGGNSPLHYDQAVVRKELKNTFLVSIPIITGNPFCPVSEEKVLKEPNGPPTPLCTIVRGSWSLGYLLLFASAIALATLATWRSARQWWTSRTDQSDQQNIVRHCTRWLLLACALITLLLYTFSNGPLDWPGIHARYLIALLVAWPAVLWPLWSAISMQSRAIYGRASRSASTALLLFVSLIYLTGTITTLAEIPGAQAEYQRDLSLINHLRGIGVTHIYTEYWTCDKLAFLSQEEIICGVVASNLEPTHNREAHYYEIVSADPRSAYVFPLDYHVPLLERNITKYRYSTFAGYCIFLPIT